MKLEIALNELHNSVRTQELWFWGKIFGTEADYFLAVGVDFKGHYEFPKKTFFYCTSGNYTFSPLPETFEYHDKDFTEKYITTAITGRPAEIIKKYAKDEEGENNEAKPDGEDVAKVDNADGGNALAVNPLDLDESIDNLPKVEIRKENFTELLKVSYIVRNIDHDTNVFPQGAFKLTVEHEVARNDAFKGLTLDSLRDFGKFHHFRPITAVKNKEIIESDEAVFRYDFQESIEDDCVKGSWSIQVDSTKTIVRINNNISVMSALCSGLDTSLSIRQTLHSSQGFILAMESKTSICLL